MTKSKRATHRRWSAALVLLATGGVVALLVQPALSWIHGRRLVIIPHDILNALPMQALEAPDQPSLSPNGKQVIYIRSDAIDD